ncbi:MAG: cysteine--tRNA ligase [Gammaproteobacteria bacterium]|nr:cysteine--tRNA ligase [Gammaproteobacteria bacterium]
MLTLDLYNSLTRKKERFKPITPGKIKLYVCGITVYDACHLGHARAMVSFDVMVRFMRTAGYDVTFVRNITDIDDKIINRALERDVSIDELTTQYIASMHQDAQALGCLSPTHEPRATQYIQSIIQLIERLIKNNHAYVSESGDVCYDVSAFSEYGKLSNQDIDSLKSGVRIDVQEGKRSALDFVLWKSAKPGEPSWPSPFGAGRPGWHIECSAMAMDTLGEQFDIHGGGLDLQFPHHENEIAQSEGATGKQFANYWLHVGMLQVNQEKMSKSLGNFFTIKEMLDKYSPEVLRYFLLSSHYRSFLNYSEDNLMLASKALTRLYQTLRSVAADDHSEASAVIDASWVKRFEATMQDDFNTPEALSVLFQLSHEVNKTASQSLAATLKHIAGILGLLQASPEAFLKAGVKTLMPDAIEALINARNEARNARDFEKADTIRKSLLADGIELEDSVEGTIWRQA